MTRAGTPVAILADTRLNALRYARRHNIAAARVFWPDSPRALAYVVRQGADIVVTGSLWDHPHAEELADWLQGYLNPYPARNGYPSNLPLLRRG